MIVKQLIVGFFQVGCYIAECENTHQCVLIDPAGDEERIMATVNDLGLEVVAIINTHGHPDHTCGNRKIAALTGAKTLMHRLDDEYFSSPAGEAMARQFGIEPSPPADTHIQDGERIEIGDTSLTVIHTPGHSPGGVCLYGENNLFTGDTLFVGAVGRTDFAGGSLDTLLESIKTKILILPDDTIIWPGHDYGVSPTSTVGNERKTNPYLAGLSQEHGVQSSPNEIPPELKMGHIFIGDQERGRNNFRNYASQLQATFTGMNQPYELR